MSRIFLGGVGDPIPQEALPDAHNENVTTLIIEPNDGEIFVPADYTGLGYTHYEAWCVGGAGGRGGPGGVVTAWNRGRAYTVTLDVMEWAAFCARVYRSPQFTDPIWVNSLGRYISLAEYANLANPSRQLEIIEYNSPHIAPDPTYGIGGGGGGGGLQIVVGRLDELAEGVLCSVGQSGVDAQPGEVFNDTSYPAYPTEYGYYTATLVDVLWEFQKLQYPNPPETVLAAQRGQDGGSASFGDICMASGGKGGKGAGPKPGGYSFTPPGGGGDGGTGGTRVAGGGGAGAPPPTLAGWTSDYFPIWTPIVPEMGHDGSWDPEARLGHGGGGGHGGQKGAWKTSTGGYGSQVYYQDVSSSNGGLGSFSYVDLSVYGQRQARQAQDGRVILPGGGGGAKLPGGRKYGSRALGFNPNGVVILRLYKVA